MKLQVGYERYDKKERVVRVTPVDYKLDEITGFFLTNILSQLDKKDIQPNDGEYDIPVEGMKHLPEFLKKYVPPSWHLGDKGENLFIRVSP